MENQSMTALVSAFARGYHAAQAGAKVFDDSAANLLLSPQERQGIAENMARGIAFFNPSFAGDADAALRWIVDHQLAPSPLGRAAFAEDKLRAAAARGVRQYLILASGLDSFALRRPDWAREMQVFEVDRAEMIADKRRRIEAAGLPLPERTRFIAADLAKPDALDELRACAEFDAAAPCFASLLGISYYLAPSELSMLLSRLRELLSGGSLIALDYPSRGASETFERQTKLASAAGEGMKAAYSPNEMRALMLRCGFEIALDLSPEQITEAYFAAYSEAHPDAPMRALPQVRYLLARA